MLYFSDEGDYEDVLNQLILRAVQANTGNSMLCQTLNIWGWDGKDVIAMDTHTVFGFFDIVPPPS